MPLNLKHAKHLLRRLRSTPLHPQWLLNARATLRPALQRIESGIVLDIGCADRWVERYLQTSHASRFPSPRSPAPTYIGLDSVATGALLYRARPSVFGDAGQLPFADASIDHVVLIDVLEHLAAPQAALAEIARVLRPGGQLLLSAPFLYPLHDAPHDYQRHTEFGLRRDIHSAGLEVEEIYPALGAAETAGFIACLALSGCVLQSYNRKHPSLLVAPFLLSLIPIINSLAWAVGRVLPSWNAITTGYILIAIRPSGAAQRPDQPDGLWQGGPGQAQTNMPYSAS